MKIAAKFLNDLIAHTGRLADGSTVTAIGVCRLALDLREAREKIAKLESEIQLLRAPTKSKKPSTDTTKPKLRVVKEIVLPGKKVDFRA